MWICGEQHRESTEKAQTRFPKSESTKRDLGHPVFRETLPNGVPGEKNETRFGGRSAVAIDTYVCTATEAYDTEGCPAGTVRSTHNKAEWFVPANTAVAGLTPAQASWTDKSGNHSVGQLANHLVFWDRESLAKFKGEQPAKFDGNNDETFNNFDAKSWDQTVKQLDQVMTDWEQAVEAADDAKIALWASRIAHVARTTPTT